MKTHFNLSLAIVASVAMLGASFADLHKATPVKLPANLGKKLVHVQVGPDHIGHVVNSFGVHATGGNGDNLIYDTASWITNFYYPSGATKEEIDGIPLGGASIIDGGMYVAYAPGAGTYDVDVNFYDLSGTNGQDIYETACAAVGGAPIAGGTFTAVPQDSANLQVIGFLFSSPVCVFGDVAMGVRFYNVTDTSSGNPGLIISDASNSGEELGAPAQDFDVYTSLAVGGFESSAGDSDNYWTEYDNVALTNTCYYWGGNPMANWPFQVWGNHGLQVQLSGDYGGLGPRLASFNFSAALSAFTGDNYIHVEVTDNPATFAYNTTVRVTTTEDDIFGVGFADGSFSLGFDSTLTGATRDIYVRGFKGYCSAAATGNVVPDTAIGCAVTVVDMPLVAGDVTGDNKVNLFDINSCLGNFGYVGPTVP